MDDTSRLGMVALVAVLVSRLQALEGSEHVAVTAAEAVAASGTLQVQREEDGTLLLRVEPAENEVLAKVVALHPRQV